jgi:putative flippase GtrA
VASALGTLSGEAIRYGVIGAAGYFIAVGVFNLLAYGGASRIDPVTANIVALAVATVMTWLGNRYFVFPHRRTRSAGHELALFFLFAALGVGISVGVLAVSHYVLGLTSQLADNLAANVVGFGLATLFRFFAYRRFVFPARGPSSPATPIVKQVDQRDA